MLAPVSRRVVGSWFLGGLAASLVGVSIVGAVLAARGAAPAGDPCALAMDTSGLPARDRTLVARRLLACSDVTHGRISDAQYRAQIAAIDAQWSPPAAVPVTIDGLVTPPPVLPFEPVWATTVREVSTQYTDTSWAATRALGAPDVYPASGDNANAWASRGADDRDEVLELGFAQPTYASAARIVETFNPGAVRSIRITTDTGAQKTIYRATPRATGTPAQILEAPFGGCETVVAVRVELASTVVPGWNEIDAVGLAPCLRLTY